MKIENFCIAEIQLNENALYMFQCLCAGQSCHQQGRQEMNMLSMCHTCVMATLLYF